MHEFFSQLCKRHETTAVKIVKNKAVGCKVFIAGAEDLMVALIHSNKETFIN